MMALITILVIAEITTLEIVPTVETTLTIEIVLTVEIAIQTPTEHRQHLRIETVAMRETIRKDKLETITISPTDQTRQQVKTTNVHQTTTPQATTPTEAAVVVCLEEAQECLAAAAERERPVAVAAEDSRLVKLEINQPKAHANEKKINITRNWIII